MSTAAIYIRVSTEDQAERGYSLREQEHTCRSYAAQLGCHEPVIIKDEGISGSILERPGLQRLLAIASSVEYVICKDPDRLARNLGHQLLITERIESTGAKLRFVDFERQPTPEGQLFYALRGAIAEYERSKISQRMMAGKIQKAREGGIPTGVNAYGYRHVNGQVEIDPTEAEIVRKIYHWYVDGMGSTPPPVPPGEIARTLNAMGVPTKTGEGRWYCSMVRRILRSPTYTGRLIFHRYDTVGRAYNAFRPRQEKIRPRERPQSEWIEVPIPAIVPEELWEEAQRLHRLAASLRPAPKRIFPFLLTGLAVCGRCGYHVVGASFVRRKSGTRYAYYTCRYRHGTGRCLLPRVRADEVEEAVWALVRSWIEQPDLYREYIESQKERSVDEDRQQTEGALRSIKEEQKRLLRLYQKGLGPAEEIEHTLAELAKRESELAARLARLRDVTQGARATPEEIAARLRHVLDSPTASNKRAAIHKLIQRITFIGRESRREPYRLEIAPR